MKNVILRLKKAGALILAAVLFLSFAACQQDAMDNSSQTSDDASSKDGLLSNAFQVLLGESAVSASHMNVFPVKDESILYTREF